MEMTDQGEAGGMREPSGAWRAMVPGGQGGANGSEWPWNPHAMTELVTWSPKANPGCMGAKLKGWKEPVKGKAKGMVGFGEAGRRGREERMDVNINNIKQMLG